MIAAIVISIIILVTLFCIFGQTDRTCKDGVVRTFPSLWHQWRKKKEPQVPSAILPRILPPAPIPWEPMEQENPWLEEVGIPSQYRARPPQWVSVSSNIGSRPANAAELQQIVDMEYARQAMMSNGTWEGVSIGAHTSPRPAGAHPVNWQGVQRGTGVAPRSAEYDNKMIKKADKQPQSIDRFDKIDEE
jgi:hypothetical protein